MANDDSPKLTKEEARALVEAGYMPLKDYLEMFSKRTDAIAAPDGPTNPAHASATPRDLLRP